MHRRLLTLGLVVGLLAGAGSAASLSATAASAAAAAAPTAPYFAASINGPAVWNPDVAVWSALPPMVDSSNATFSADRTGVSAAPYLFSLSDRSGSPLATGHYTVGPAATDAAFAVTVDGVMVCTDPATTGTLDIQQIAFDGSGNISHLAADYVLTCNSRSYSGLIRFSSSVGYAEADSAPEPVDFGSVYDQTTSPTKTLTITGRGSTPYKISGPITLTGTHPTSFAVTQDGCTGVSLSYGQTCTIQLTARPRGTGHLIAQLVMPDNTGHGSRLATLGVTSPFNAQGKFLVSSARVLDTRDGTGARKGLVHGGTAIHITPVGTSTQAGKTGAVVLNLTVTSTTSPGFVTVYPSGAPRPGISSINFPAGWTGSNLVTVRLGAGHGVDLYLSSGSAHLVADLKGYYLAAPDSTSYAYPYFPLVKPFRLMDSRTSGGTHDPLLSHYYQELGIEFTGLTNSAVTALAINLTVTGVKATGGYVVAYRGDSGDYSWEFTSTLNPRAHETTATTTLVPAKACYSGWCGGQNMVTFRIYNGTGHALDYLVDVVGFYADSSLAGGTVFRPLTTPTRIVDTRKALGAKPFGAASTQTIDPPGAIAGLNTAALAANLTAVGPTANTFLTLWPSIAGVSRPGVSNINPAAGRTVANAAFLTVGEAEDVKAYNASGRTDLLIDVAGTFENFPEILPPAGALIGSRSAAAQSPGRSTAPSVARKGAAPATRLR